MSLKYVYVAGPYTNGDTEWNVKMAMIAADKLAQAGFIPFVPHLSHFWHLYIPHDYQFWMDLTSAWLERCDCALRLPGESPGADKEITMAMKLRIPVFFSPEHLIEYCLLNE